MQGHASANTVYGMGFIGAVYFVSTATSFWMGMWGFVKAVFWNGDNRTFQAKHGRADLTFIRPRRINVKILPNEDA